MKSIAILVVFLSISAIASPVAKETDCEQGWESICLDDTCNCYKFIDENLPYDVAKQICIGFGSALPSIHSEKENRILYVFPSRNDKGAWLGLTRNSTFSFAWSDGTAFDYSSWQADSPSNGANDRDCVHFVGSSDDGYSTPFEWRDSPCNELRPVICQKTQTPFVPSTTLAPVPVCSGNYVLHCLSTGECNCYRAVRINTNWKDAVSFCRSEGTDLISIHSEEENAYARNLAGDYKTWIGITYGDELWSDGSAISYSNWYKSYTNGFAAVIYNGFTYWVAFDLGTSNHGANALICKTAQAPFVTSTTTSTTPSTTHSTTPSTTPTPVPACPGNYTLHCLSTGECNCYRMVESAMRWLDAQRFCRSEGTELISIHSEEENTFAWNIKGGLDVWIGITYDSELWSDGSVKSYSNWGDSSFLIKGDGGHFHHGGVWVDRTWCANTFGTDFNFICKLKLGTMFTS